MTPSSSTIRYGIALGSNLGDRLGNLQAAVSRLLEDSTVRLIAAAPVYESDPVDCPEGSQSFYNTVIEIDADMEPIQLLRRLRSIEASLGRPNDHGHHAPRTVDLDVLYAGDLVMTDDELVLPHPRMTQRRFVMQPLADIRPDLMLPWQEFNVEHILTGLPDDFPLRVVASEWL